MKCTLFITHLIYHKKEITIFIYFIAMHWVMSPEPQLDAGSVINIPAVADLLLTRQYFVAQNKTHWLKQQLSTTTDQILDVERKTRGQRSNPWWMVARKLRLTASNFGVILGSIKRNR